MKMWMWVAAWYGAMSLVTFVAYWRDTRAAGAGRWRVRERTLHGLELLGGWPGGIVARRVLRHKTRSVGFCVVSWGIVVGHALGWGIWAWMLAR